MESFGVVVTICSGAAVIIGLVSTIIALIKNIKKQNALIREGLCCLLRSQILNNYYACKDKGTIRQYQRENVDALDAAYVALGGNSFIADVYEEIRDLKVTT